MEAKKPVAPNYCTEASLHYDSRTLQSIEDILSSAVFDKFPILALTPVCYSHFEGSVLMLSKAPKAIGITYTLLIEHNFYDSHFKHSLSTTVFSLGHAISKMQLSVYLPSQRMDFSSVLHDHTGP